MVGTTQVRFAAALVAEYDPCNPAECASGLRSLWLSFEAKSIEGISAEQRSLQETVGIPVPVLKAIGKEVGKAARRRVDAFLPLARLLWDDYGREGRVVALVALGAMELSDPSTIVPLLRDMGRSCITWEDADRLAMDAWSRSCGSTPRSGFRGSSRGCATRRNGCAGRESPSWAGYR